MFVFKLIELHFLLLIDLNVMMLRVAANPLLGLYIQVVVQVPQVS